MNLKKVRDCKNITFNQLEQSALLHTRYGDIKVSTGSDFKISYRGTAVYVKNGDQWVLLNNPTANKIGGFLGYPCDKDHHWDYYKADMQFTKIGA